jgi:hypothetical protein
MLIYLLYPIRRDWKINLPRTAGRFLEENFKENGFDLEQDDIWKSVDGIELAHFHRELYEKHLDVEGIPHISIIRNPINRFFSASSWLKRMYGEDIQEAMEDPMMFSMMLENFPLTQAVNWYRPQVDFISDVLSSVYVPLFFTSCCVVDVPNVLDVPFRAVDVPYQKLAYDESNKLERSAKLIDNIKYLYRKDIELYYPELEASL